MPYLSRAVSSVTTIHTCWAGTHVASKSSTRTNLQNGTRYPHNDASASPASFTRGPGVGVGGMGVGVDVGLGVAVGLGVGVGVAVGTGVGVGMGVNVGVGVGGNRFTNTSRSHSDWI